MEDREERAFEARVAPLRASLRGYCYRMMGSLQDADDAVQETLLAAWKGRATFAGRSSWRAWLMAIAHNCCLALLSRRSRRLLGTEWGPAATGVELAPTVDEPVWLEPYPADAEAAETAEGTILRRESVELAFVAALQHLPASQRAALILSEVLGFEAAETAVALGTSVAAVNSALQRARATLAARLPAHTQAEELRRLGDEGQRALVTSFVRAWEDQDVEGLVKLLAADVRFSMPPIPTWFEGARAVARFFTERIFATAWRIVPLRVSGQLGFACYQGPTFHLGALNVSSVRAGRFSEMTGFLSPAVHAFFSEISRATDEFSRAGLSREA